MGIEVGVKSPQECVHIAVHPGPVNATERIEWLAPHIDVLSYIKVGKEGRLLMNDRDATTLGLSRVVKDGGLAIDLEAAAIGSVDSGENFDQGALAGAVLPNQSVHLSGIEWESDMVEYFDVAETLGAVADERERLRREGGARLPVLGHWRHRRLLLSLKLVAGTETLQTKDVAMYFHWNVSMGASILIARGFVKWHERPQGNCMDMEISRDW